MGYEKCLVAAGAEVLAFKEFGSYQGDWYAKVSYNGEIGWITGCYGSCSGCDAFEAEFGWEGDGCEKHRYCPEQDCAACTQAAANLQTRYADFGRTYLDTIYDQGTQEAVLRNIIAENNWDVKETTEILTFVEENK